MQMLLSLGNPNQELLHSATITRTEACPNQICHAKYGSNILFLQWCCLGNGYIRVNPWSAQHQCVKQQPPKRDRIRMVVIVGLGLMYPKLFHVVDWVLSY